MTEQQAGTRFVGRARELADLVALLDRSDLGRGRLVLIGGEPGIGKSRLADELASRARDLGHLVLWGRAWEDAGAPPYWPWIQALRTYLRSTAADDVRRQVGIGATDLAQMLPELHELFAGLAAPREQGSESARFQLFDSTASLLRNAARERPLLVVIDDLQAADTPSILLLQFLASQLSDMSVLIVGTYRDVELTPGHPLTTAIAELAREPGSRLMALDGLAADAVGEYLESTASLPRRDALVTAVWRATGGNPLFVSEAVRLLSAEGRLAEVGDLSSLRVAVPASVRAVIARRVSHLGDETSRALTFGAVVGPEFGVEVLRRVMNGDADHVSELVEDAVQAGLLVAVAGVSGRYRFFHDLVRETLYDELPAGRRAAIHGRVGEALEERYGGSVEGHLAELAFHFFEAAQGAESGPTKTDATSAADKAMDYTSRAAEAAVRSLAFEEAARFHRMTLIVLDASVAVDERARTETLLALGDAQARAGSLDDARATFLEAAEAARRTGNGHQLAQAALGFGGRHPWARPGKDTRLIPLLQDGLVMLGGEDERLRVRLLTRLACAWRSSPERQGDSDALSRQAIDIARGLEDAASLTYALTGRFWATWWPDNPAERQAIADEMVGIAEQLGEAERIADAHFMSFLTLTERGLIADARSEMETLSRVVEELRQPPQLWLEPVNRAGLALLSGEFEEAEAFIAWETASDHPINPARDDVSAARMHRFLLRREQGRVGEEEVTVRASCVDFPWYPLHRAALACLLIDLDRSAEAQVVMDGLAQGDFVALYRDNEWLLTMSLASEASSRLDDRAAATILYDQLAPFAGRHAIGHAEGSVGAVDRYLGMLSATCGDLNAAVGHLQAGIALNEAMGAQPWTAHTQHDLARILRQRDGKGDRARSAELDGAALLTATRLGMALADRITDTEDRDLRPSDGIVNTATFRREGEYWSVEYGTDVFRVRDSKGMRHLARLLSAPGHEVHALELASLEAKGSPASESPHRVDGQRLSVDGLGDAGPGLDPEAKAAYRRRLDDIREELAEAERWNDPERVVRLEAEEQALTDELAGALGLGGRDRMAASASERARVSVTRAIRTSLSRIRQQSDALGAHFDVSVRTGTFCSYVPDPRSPIAWRT